MSADLITCERLVATYRAAVLHPVLDPLYEIVRIDCPHCHAQDSDPQRIWRPVKVVPRGPVTLIHCDACGRHDERRV